MSSAPAPDAAASTRKSVRSVWLVICVAVCTSTLRIASWAAGEITLLYFYGWAAVARDHPPHYANEAANGHLQRDVLPGIGFYHYSVEVVIWLPLAFGLMMLIYYTLLPKWQQAVMQVRERNQRVSAVALLWVLALFVPGFRFAADGSRDCSRGGLGSSCVDLGEEDSVRRPRARVTYRRTGNVLAAPHALAELFARPGLPRHSQLAQPVPG